MRLALLQQVKRDVEIKKMDLMDDTLIVMPSLNLGTAIHLAQLGSKYFRATCTWYYFPIDLTQNSTPA
jgi:hypothetical protein